MLYLIDSANQQEIDNALKIGVSGVTANPTLYLSEKRSFYDFLEYNNQFSSFLTAEVIIYTESQAEQEIKKIMEISSNIIIKLNYSFEGLNLTRKLKEKGIKVAMTLIFDVNQAMLAINAGVDFLFLFISRNEEIGEDGLEFVRLTSKIIKEKKYNVQVVASSIRNVYQLRQVSLYADYVASPYKLIRQSFENTLTQEGITTFTNDMQGVK
ncbi:MAG TPA: transaldolase family protein [Pseudogracilibacillus sp.]|nr:transaldolase family protein [Pseudogracilibacillus sp.]